MWLFERLFRTEGCRPQVLNRANWLLWPKSLCFLAFGCIHNILPEVCQTLFQPRFRATSDGDLAKMFGEPDENHQAEDDDDKMARIRQQMAENRRIALQFLTSSREVLQTLILIQASLQAEIRLIHFCSHWEMLPLPLRRWPRSARVGGGFQWWSWRKALLSKTSCRALKTIA